MSQQCDYNINVCSTPTCASPGYDWTGSVACDPTKPFSVPLTGRYTAKPFAPVDVTCGQSAAPVHTKLGDGTTDPKAWTVVGCHVQPPPTHRCDYQIQLCTDFECTKPVHAWNGTAPCDPNVIFRVPMTNSGTPENFAPDQVLCNAGTQNQASVLANGDLSQTYYTQTSCQMSADPAYGRTSHH